MKARIILLLIALLANGIIVFAQNTGSIKGELKSSDGHPAAYVTLTLTNLGKSVKSNEQGKYSFNKLAPGTYTIKMTAIGVNSQSKEVTVNPGEEVELNFALTESNQVLKDVIINANKSKYTTTEPSTTLRINEPLIEAPQNIQVVTSQAISDQQIISMSDGLIRNVSGAVRLEHWGDLYTNITMRGSQIQAFRNGFNVVASYWGPLTEDMSIVDHIEFVKGPSSFMLANGDPSGLYNVVTKKPTGQTKGEFSATLGSFDLYRSSLDLDGKLSKDGKLLYRLNVAGQTKGSHRPYEYNNRYTIAPVLSYQLSDNTKLTAEYTLQNAKMTEVGSYYVFATDGYAILPVDFTMTNPGLPATKINDHSAFITLEHRIDDNWKLTAQGAYFKYTQQGMSSWPSSVAENGGIVRNVGIWDAESEMSLGQVFLNGNIYTGSVRHRILAGLDMGKKNYMADWGQSHDLDTAGGEFNIYAPTYGYPNNGYPSFDRSQPLSQRAVAAGGLMDQRYNSFYAQDELGFLDGSLRVTLAGRYTYVSQSAWGASPDEAKHFTPRLGISYSVLKNLSVYGVYDQAFTPQSGIIYSGEAVKPLTGNNIEFGLKQDWFDGKWNSTLSIYQITKQNELTADPERPNSQYSIVVGEKVAKGFEFDIRGEIVSGFNVVANYAYTDSKVTETAPGVTAIAVGDVIPGFSKHTANGWLNYKIQKGRLEGIGFSGGFTWLGDRATDTWSVGLQKLPNYFKLDGGLFYENKKFKIMANAFNVLDKYLYSGSYYEWLNAYYWQTEAPRNYRLSINYKF
ncbi:TonB-dependent receptor [Olivibacter sitiensis]|uniref:TonB-dependent receptor n=1 Tax=Olivibacter sitiensis TaxID=376470 RepID=UPI000411A144|nr:TonB-dependent receptor [Olivibacter sitiensis]